VGAIKNPKKFIFIAGFVTLVGIGGLGLLLIYFFHKAVWYSILHVSIESLLRQFITGTVYAIITLIPLVFLLERRMLDATRYFFADLMKKFTVSTPEIFLLSLCAGVGEELLFRGAIQPWIGIWPTSIIFIALHGYLNPKDRPMFIYGIVLLVVSAGFGYLLQFSGIYAAMTAHFWIDVVLMLYLKRNSGKHFVV
jgi:membrane protease YdiL (CAAX protease family)